MLGLGGVDSEVYVCDGEGELWVSATQEDGVKMASPGQGIHDLPPELVERMNDQKKSFEVEREYEFIGKRFFVDPAGRGVFIFARLPQNE